MTNKLREHLPTLASVAVGIIPVYILIAHFEVPRKLIIGWGVLSYVIGVTAIKMPLYHLFVVKVLHGRLSNLWLSVSHGFVSAISELGAAFVFFVFVVPNLTLVQLIGFGAAAGATEAIMLPFIKNPLKGTAVEDHATAVVERSERNPMIAWMGVLERALAFIPHITARGLVYVSFATGNIIPALLAVSTFASLDGRAYYGLLEKWTFDDIAVLGRLYRFIAFIGLLQIACFVYFSSTI